ncbi:hypothetical protein ACOMHN_012610 [Nucella lapillus]
MAKQIWHPPLPPGWEARWDPNQRAFFYIDHANKTTSWDDPRWASKQRLATPASGGYHGSGQRESIPMQNMSHRSPQHSPSGHRSHSPAPRQAHTQREETTFMDQREAEIGETLQRLRARFPEASPIIKDILRTCEYDEDEAANQLMELGFNSHQNPPRSSSHASPARSSSGKRSTTTSPHRSTATTPKKSVSPARHQSPAKPQMSEDEKKRRHTKLCEEFSKLEAEVVKMALEACQYDENKTRITLSRVTNQFTVEPSRETRGASGSASASASRGHPPSSQRTTSPVPMGEPASLEPVALSQDRPLPSGSGGSSVPVGSRHAGSRTVTGTAYTAGKRTVTSRVTASSSTAPHAKQEHQRRAKHVTLMSEQLLSTTNDMLNHLASSASSCCPPSHTHQHPSPSHSPHPSPAHSLPENRSPGEERTEPPAGRDDPASTPAAQCGPPAPPRTMPVGSGLARGPDPSLLLGPDPRYHAGPELGLPYGPNPELCDGPDPEILLGASMGADGPNLDYYQGNVPDLIAGSWGATGPNPNLRCSAQYPSPIEVDQRFMQTTI